MMLLYDMREYSTQLPSPCYPLILSLSSLVSRQVQIRPMRLGILEFTPDNLRVLLASRVPLHTKDPGDTDEALAEGLLVRQIREDVASSFRVFRGGEVEPPNYAG